MINIRLGELMGRKRMNQATLSKAANIRPNTVSMLYHGTLKHLDLEHLDSLCRVLECTPGDLIEYIPDENSQE